MNDSASAAAPPILRRFGLRDGAAVAILLTAAALLRLPQIHASLWLDELHTAWTVVDGFSQIAPRAMYGNQSPLFFYLSAVSVEVGGPSEAALRVPSLAAGLLLVAAVYWVVLHWTSVRSAAVLAALLAAIDGDALFYSLEARPYALVQLGGLLHVFVWSRVVRQPTAGWRCLGVGGAALLVYLHYTAALLAAAELAWLAALYWMRPGAVAYRPRQLAVDMAALAFLCLAAAPHAVWIASHRTNWESIVAPRPSVELLAMFPLACYLLPPLAILAMFALIGGGRNRRISLGAARWDIASLAACWLFVPLLLAWLTTRWEIAPLLLRRYVISASAAPIVLSAVLYAACPHRAGRAICFAVVAGWAAIAPGGFLADSTGRIILDGPLSRFVMLGEFVDRPDESWRGAIAAVNRDSAAANLPVLVRSGLIEDNALRDRAADEQLRAYCLFPVRSLYPIDESRRTLIPLPTTHSGQLRPEVQEQIIEEGGAWMLLRTSREDSEHIVGQVLAGLHGRGVAAETALHEAFGGVVLVKLLASRAP